tara:strand:+ start:750 stop:1004 length:255 start_codon:yes stop_codon:yes gene_type:complete
MSEQLSAAVLAKFDRLLAGPLDGVVRPDIVRDNLPALLSAARENARLREAMENIVSHQRIAGGGGKPPSVTYQIATAALTSEDH